MEQLVSAMPNGEGGLTQTKNRLTSHHRIIIILLIQQLFFCNKVKRIVHETFVRFSIK